MSMRRFVFLLLLSLRVSPAGAETPDLAPVKKWIARQDELRTVQADFVQTRSFKNLRDPLAVPGHIWYSAPGSFRWEAGEPPRMIVLRKGETYYVIQPGKKRAERTPTTAMNSGAGGHAMPMMDFPFASSFDDFNRRFETLSVKTEGNRCHLELLPRDPQARKALAAVRIDFDTESGHLIAFEFVTRDGSTLRNEFSNPRINQKIDPRVFDYDFTGYEVVDAKP